jgi:hypothetical protein
MRYRLTAELQPRAKAQQRDAFCDVVVAEVGNKEKEMSMRDVRFSETSTSQLLAEGCQGLGL